VRFGLVGCFGPFAAMSFPLLSPVICPGNRPVQVMSREVIPVPGPRRRRLELARVQSAPTVPNHVRFLPVQAHVLVAHMPRHRRTPLLLASAGQVAATTLPSLCMVRPPRRRQQVYTTRYFGRENHGRRWI
jgi:hypothetical protein